MNFQTVIPDLKWFMRIISEFEESSSPKRTSCGVIFGKLIQFLHQYWTDFHSSWVSWGYVHTVPDTETKHCRNCTGKGFRSHYERYFRNNFCSGPGLLCSIFKRCNTCNRTEHLFLLTLYRISFSDALFLYLVQCQLIAWQLQDKCRMLSGSLLHKAWFLFTANSTTTTQKQSDYVIEQSSFPLIAFVLTQNWSLSWSKLALSLVSIKPITTKTTTNFESK